jgi:hypothetical protein
VPRRRLLPNVPLAKLKMPVARQNVVLPRKPVHMSASWLRRRNVRERSEKSGERIAEREERREERKGCARRSPCQPKTVG